MIASLKRAEEGYRAELTVGIDNQPPTPPATGDPTNAGDKGGRLSSCRADADGVGLASNTSVADIDIVTARGEIDAG